MAGFHEGELAVQTRAGVQAEAARLEGMLAPPDLDGGARRFLAAQRFAAVAARDTGGTLWVSALVGPAGFLDAHGTVVDVGAMLRPGDPLDPLTPGGQLGMVAIDLPRRRRMRVNGTIVDRDDAGFRIEVDEAYGNCPKYLHPHEVEPGPGGAPAQSFDGTALQPAHEQLVAAADTFFLGTVHPTRGADASHRGGPVGFVVVEPDGSVSWPDLPGNNMFNSFGNLAVDPSAALLFVDFDTGTTLHLTGRAEIQWRPAGRRVRFTPTRVVVPELPLPIHVGVLDAE